MYIALVTIFVIYNSHHIYVRSEDFPSFLSNVLIYPNANYPYVCNGIYMDNSWILTLPNCIKNAVTFDIHIEPYQMSNIYDGRKIFTSQYTLLSPKRNGTQVAMIKGPEYMNAKVDYDISDKLPNIQNGDKMTVTGFIISQKDIPNSASYISFENLELNNTKCKDGYFCTNPSKGYFAAPVFYYRSGYRRELLGILDFSTQTNSYIIPIAPFVDWIQLNSKL